MKGSDLKIYAIRDDVTNWAQLMHSKRKPPGTTINIYNIWKLKLCIAVERVWKPQIQANDWTQRESHRKFMENFARDKGFDPLIPKNWYSFKRTDIAKEVLTTSSNIHFLLFFLGSRVTSIL